MAAKVKWIQRGNYSGLMIRGTKSFDINKELDTHLGRVVSLTSIVESNGLFGTVMNYDGTGMTAGIAQCIALYPREIRDADNFADDDQGPLWRLIQAIHERDQSITKELYKALNKAGLVIRNGVVRNIKEDNVVDARTLRGILSPADGVVPKSGQDWERAKRWGLIFHELFSNTKTFSIQIEDAKEHIRDGISRRPRALNLRSAKELIYNKLPDEFTHRNEPLDLALACLWSNAVNAPAPAYKLLGKILDEKPNFLKETHREAVAIKILKSLKNTERKNWQKRYKRTRKAAMKIWPQKFFKGPTAIMP